MSVLHAGPRSGEHQPDPIGSFDLHDQSLPFEPVTARLRYPPPQATIDPDTSKGWIARMWPVLRSHTALFVVALLAGMVSMIVRVLVPTRGRDRRRPGAAARRAAATPWAATSPCSPCSPSWA